MSRPLRVLYLAHSVSASGGGMERQSHALLSAESSDLAFTVIASDGLNELPTSVTTVKLRLPRRPAVVRIVWFYLLSARYVRRLQTDVDVVHACGALTSERVDLATVHLCHAAVSSDARSTLSGWRKINADLARRAGLAIERRQYRRSAVKRLVAVSPSVARELAAFYPDVPRSVVQNGVDVGRFQGPTRAPRSDDSLLRVVMVAGDFSLKGVDLAMNAVTHVPRTQLRVVGRGALEQYRAKASSLGVDDRVSFLGQISDVVGVYGDSDVVLCVSNYESFGLYLVEAALAGCAVIATPVGVAPELLGSNQGGIGIEHTVESLIAALVALRDDPARVQQCAAYAANAARQFSTDAMRAGYLAQYRELAP